MGFNASADMDVVGKTAGSGRELPDAAPVIAAIEAQGFFLCPADALAASDDGNASYAYKLAVELEVQVPVEAGDATTADGKREGFNPLRAKAYTVAEVAAFLRKVHDGSGLKNADGSDLPDDATNGVRAAALNRAILEALTPTGAKVLKDLDRDDAYVGVIKPWPKRSWTADLAAYRARA